ncbi:hypothetical protein MKX07_008861 [Trichoderma sp. CBMAI-0711]|nr:hypothetical protein MKX07_008861 [Trichoderma sp. CBMAI-0711]
MGGRQIRPAGVYKAVSQELKHAPMPGYAVPTPPWFAVMNSVPPSETLVRNVTPRHRMPNPKAIRAGGGKPKKLFRPQSVSYPEDALRTSFYKDHPWELARPRVVLELDGKDYQSVVQRQLWLMENQLVDGVKMSKRKAYDIVRREFYRLRQEEEVEKRIAVEEARYVGAYFGKTRLEVGMQLEDQEYENWKIWAGKETANREARASSEIETFGLEEEEDAALETAEAQPLPVAA